MEAGDLLKRFEVLRANRDGYWLSVWREVRRYVMPTYSDFKVEGGARGRDIFNTTAIEARSRLAAGMYNWMAPPDQRWFELIPSDNEKADDAEIKEYFAEVTRIVQLALANSNWVDVLIQTLNNLACGMDGVVYCEDGGEQSILSFTTFPVETVCYSEDGKGKVDTLFREVTMTSRQMVREFKKGELPEKIVEEANDPQRMDNKHQLLHVICPRCERDRDCMDNKNMKYADVYIDLESKKTIYESGYEEIPFAVCRFEKSENEQYGRGPGLNMLPTIKMANRMSQAYILGREHQSDPSFLVPDGSLVNRDFNKDPGSIVVYKPDINGAKPEVMQNTVNYGTLFQDIQTINDTIKMGFYWDIFDPIGDLKNITATEAEIRNEGKMVPFAPIAGKLHSELFGVLIHRAYSIAARRGILPPPPPQLLENPDYKIEYVSKIAQSLKKKEILGWMQTEASLANLAATRPDLLDNFDLDEVARDVAMVNGCNPKWLASEKDRDALRAERAQQQAQAQAMEQLSAGASALGSNLGKTPEQGSPLDALMNDTGAQL